jgi:hypothetical protein
MKQVKQSILIVLFLVLLQTVNAQKKSLAVFNLDSQGVELTPDQLGNLARMEIEKLDLYEVMDRYDVNYMIKKHQLDIEGCYGKICLVEMGKLIGSDKMLSGSVELYGDKIVVSIRLIDVATETIEKAQVREFLNLQDELQAMVRIVLKEMFGMQVDELLLARITKNNQYESVINNPNETTLNLGGPRLGITYFTGELGRRLQEDKKSGGFDAYYPAMFMFGYQIEIQYLNSGNFQSLFEFVPSITGVDQGLLLPNLAVMIGFRHNVKGWEFALGPTVGMVKSASGYFDADGKWILKGAWDGGDGENPHVIEKRVDSRGVVDYHTGFIVAAGKSFRSGRMNFPVNAYMIPSKDGIRFGITFGFNAKR